MPRKCGVCSHSSRLSIERALARGLSQTRVAETFDVSRNSIVAHLKNHMPKALEERWRSQKNYGELCNEFKNLQGMEVEKLRAEGMEFVIKEVLKLYRVGQRALQQAQQEEDYRSVLLGIREIQRLLKFHLELWSMVADDAITLNKVDIISSEEWRWLEGIVLDILKDEPKLQNKLSVRLLEESQKTK